MSRRVSCVTVCFLVAVRIHLIYDAGVPPLKAFEVVPAGRHNTYKNSYVFCYCSTDGDSADRCPKCRGERSPLRLPEALSRDGEAGRSGRLWLPSEARGRDPVLRAG